LWGEGVYKFLLGIPEGKRPLGRPRRRWVDNIRMDLHNLRIKSYKKQNCCEERGCIGSWWGYRRKEPTEET